MAAVTANMSDVRDSPGKMRRLLNWLLSLVPLLFRLNKKKKTARKGKTRTADKDTSEDEVDIILARWTPERLNIIDKLWGEGCISPSSAEFLQTTAPLLGLSGEKSLLLMGAGLGGLGRALVETTGVWVTGVEDDEELAGIGKELTKMTGMQKRAPVTLNDFEQPKLKESAFNAVVSLETLYKVANKEQLYKAMIGALRVQGELRMTDFVIPKEEPPNEALKSWLALEPTPPTLWTPDKIHFVLSSMNVDMRPADDITAKYRSCVFKGFFGYLSQVTKPELMEVSDDLIAEVEFWAKTISAIDSGALKVFQFHAIKLPEKRKAVI